MDRSRLDALAESQFSLLTRAQLVLAGVSDVFIAWRLASDRWRQTYPGVSLTSPGCDDWVMHAMAAVLVCGRGAVLSHRSAGHSLGLVKVAPEVNDVLIPHSRTVSAREGITVRWSPHLPARAAPGGGRPMGAAPEDGRTHRARPGGGGFR